MRIPFLLPGDIWHGMFRNRCGCFLVDKKSDVQSFWQNVGRTHPALKNHPVKQIEDYQTRAVPIVLHGDGAPVTLQLGSGSKSCQFLSIRSLVGRQQHRHFLLCALWCGSMVKTQMFNTSQAIFQMIQQDLAHLFEEQGAATKSFFPVLVFTTGDLEYFSDHHQLPRWNATAPCSLCNVTKDNHKQWRRDVALPEDDWMLPRKHLLRCPLFHTILSPQAICPDPMHAKHLGVDLRLLGSVIWLLVNQKSEAASWDDRVADILHQLHMFWQSKREVKGLLNLTTGMFMDPQDKQCRKKFPKLKVKAAEATSCLKAALHVWKLHLDQEQQADVWVKLLLESAVAIDDMIRQSTDEWSLCSEDGEKLLDMGKRYCMLNVALERHFWNTDSRKLFQSGTFKHHWMLHALQLARHISPKRTWCYSGETYMSSCKTLLKSCLKGRGPLAALHSFMDKYVLALSREVVVTWSLK